MRGADVNCPSRNISPGRRNKLSYTGWSIRCVSSEYERETSVGHLQDENWPPEWLLYVSRRGRTFRAEIVYVLRGASGTVCRFYSCKWKRMFRDRLCSLWHWENLVRSGRQVFRVGDFYQKELPIGQTYNLKDFLQTLFEKKARSSRNLLIIDFVPNGAIFENTTLEF